MRKEKINKAYKDLIDSMRSEYLNNRNDDKDFAKEYGENDNDFNDWIGEVWHFDEVINDIHNRTQLNFSLKEEEYIEEKFYSTIEKLNK